MGNFLSRRNGGVEEVDISNANAYRFPPSSGGCYFGSHFIMGGERFETSQPESYLFGDNSDLNFLGNRPIPSHEPTKTLKSLVNIRKDSVRFQKVIKESKPDSGEEETTDKNTDEPERHLYNIDFTFDTDVRVAITVYYFATEEITNGHVIYTPRDASMNSETFRYKRGANQTFNQSTHIVEPANFPDDEWQYSSDKGVIPIVIQCVVEDEVDFSGHSHQLLACVERCSESGYTLKPLKQKQMIEGLCYLIQEIYGIENKNQRDKLRDDDLEDGGSECVICMSDVRDTIILPCRHLCLCNCCADNLRIQASCCPICRVPFRALLQIRAMRKKLPNSPVQDEESLVSQEGVPQGFEAVTLIEALNGPGSLHPSTPTINIRSLPRSLPPDARHATAVEESETTPLAGRRSVKRNSSSRSSNSSRTRDVTSPESAPTKPTSAQSAPVSPCDAETRSLDAKNSYSPLQTRKTGMKSCDDVTAAYIKRSSRKKHSSTRQIQDLLQQTKAEVIQSFQLTQQEVDERASARMRAQADGDTVRAGGESPPPAYEILDRFPQAESNSEKLEEPIFVESLEDLSEDNANEAKPAIATSQDSDTPGSSSSGSAKHLLSDSDGQLAQSTTFVES